MDTRDPIISHAIAFASFKHRSQVRKYTGEPYVNHCLNVAALVETVLPYSKESPEHGKAMLCAAILHDTLEDTDTTLADLHLLFGKEVADLVFELTDQFPHVPGGPNRASRKMAECTRLEQVSASAQTIKVADLLDNTRTIVEYDLGFAITYLSEKAALLNVLTKADANLLWRAQVQVRESFARL